MVALELSAMPLFSVPIIFPVPISLEMRGNFWQRRQWSVGGTNGETEIQSKQPIENFLVRWLLRHDRPTRAFARHAIGRSVVIFGCDAW